jgi:hypothetical protein
VGAAIAQIFSRQSAFPRHVAKLRDSLAGVSVREYTAASDGSLVAVA